MSGKSVPPPARMRVVKNAYVVLDYALYDAEDDLIEATDGDDGQPIGLVHGHGLMLPALEAAMIGMAAGESREVTLSPEEAYGPFDEEGERWVDREDFPKDVAVEDEFGAIDDDGEETTLRVVEVTEDAVLIDSNHPLAGETIRFDLMIRSVREATPEELARVRGVAPKTGLKVLASNPPMSPNATARADEGGQPAADPLSAPEPRPRRARVPRIPTLVDDEQ
ncbi:MAG: peptidylprolyl isomerase [Polyangiales bacterium]